MQSIMSKAFFFARFFSQKPFSQEFRMGGAANKRKQPISKSNSNAKLPVVRDDSSRSGDDSSEYELSEEGNHLAALIDRGRRGRL